MSEREVTVVKTGTWLYDGQVEKPVRILRQTWDYYHEDGYDEEPPDLNDEGFAFYAVYGEPDRFATCWGRDAPGGPLAISLAAMS